MDTVFWEIWMSGRICTDEKRFDCPVHYFSISPLWLKLLSWNSWDHYLCKCALLARSYGFPLKTAQVSDDWSALAQRVICRYYRPNFQIYIHIRKTFSDLILSSVLGAGIDKNVKGFTVNCSCFILFLPRKKFFSNFFLPSLLFLSETFDSKRVNLWHRLTPFSHFVCLEHKYLPEITYF